MSIYSRSYSSSQSIKPRTKRSSMFLNDKLFYAQREEEHKAYVSLINFASLRVNLLFLNLLTSHSCFLRRQHRSLKLTCTSNKKFTSCACRLRRNNSKSGTKISIKYHVSEICSCFCLLQQDVHATGDNHL